MTDDMTVSAPSGIVVLDFSKLCRPKPMAFKLSVNLPHAHCFSFLFSIPCESLISFRYS